MRKLAAKKIELEKLNIKNRYLAGEIVRSIAESKNMTARNVYFHLGVLTPDEKALHAKNRWLRDRSMPIIKTGIALQVSVQLDGKSGESGTTKVYGQDVAHFIEG